MAITVRFMRLSESAKEPTCGSKYAAGYDLSADIGKNVYIYPHQTIKIPTGLAVELPEGTFGGIYARSGIASREGLRPANCTGVVDSDYRGEVVVALHNDSEEIRVVEPGQRIAQLIIQPYICAEFKETKSLSDTDRGSGGFGSSGK